MNDQESFAATDGYPPSAFQLPNIDGITSTEPPSGLMLRTDPNFSSYMNRLSEPAPNPDATIPPDAIMPPEAALSPDPILSNFRFQASLRGYDVDYLSTTLVDHQAQDSSAELHFSSWIAPDGVSSEFQYPKTSFATNHCSGIPIGENRQSSSPYLSTMLVDHRTQDSSAEVLFSSWIAPDGVFGDFQYPKTSLATNQYSGIPIGENGQSSSPYPRGLNSQIRMSHISTTQRPESKPRRFRLLKFAKKILNDSFQLEAYPDKMEISSIAKKTKMTIKQVRTWFGNKRRRTIPTGMHLVERV